MGWFFRQPLIPPFIEARRARIHATAASLPGVAWLVMRAGRMAAFVGLVVFVTVALDHPFQGAVTPSEDGFRIIADRPFGGQ